MATRGTVSGTPLERLKTHYEQTRMRCSACGHVDADGEWEAVTTGRVVRYAHTCPSCGARTTQVVRLQR